MTWRTWVWRGPFVAMFFIMALPMLALLIPINVMEQDSPAERIGGNILLIAAFMLIASFHNWIAVESGKVRIGFFPLYWRTLNISEIRYVIPVEFNPMRDFAGYGIKGLAKSRNGILLGGNPPHGIMIEMLDRRRYVLSFVDSERILQSLGEQGVTLSADFGDEPQG